MKRLKTWFVIADGGRARFVTKREAMDAYDTQREFVSAHLHAASRDLGTSRPGRGHESASPTRHSIQPRQDPHTAEKADFVREVAHELNQAGHKEEFDRLVLVAPARAMTGLIDALDTATRDKVAAKVRKDLTRVPDADLSTHFEDVPRA